MLFRSNDTATTEIYTTVHTLSLHDALPISMGALPARYYVRNILAGSDTATSIDALVSIEINTSTFF